MSALPSSSTAFIVGNGASIGIVALVLQAGPLQHRPHGHVHAGADPVGASTLPLRSATVAMPESFFTM